MPKLYSARQVIRALQRLGFTVVSQKGSHIKLRRVVDGVTYSPIVPNHKEIAQGTMQSILKQAGISREDLEENIWACLFSSER